VRRCEPQIACAGRTGKLADNGLIELKRKIHKR
jgi:hypothetical protein